MLMEYFIRVECLRSMKHECKKIVAACASSAISNHKLIGKATLAGANNWAKTICLSDVNQRCYIRSREPPQRQRLAGGALNFLWAIKPLQP